MAADINRDMREKGIVQVLKDSSGNVQGAYLDMEKFRAALESGLMDINVFKQVMR